MKKITVVIERSKDSFWAYSNDLQGITGVGDNINDVKKSIWESLDIQKELGNIPNCKYEFILKFDTQSFLKYYKGIFTKAALERLTGIS